VSLDKLGPSKNIHNTTPKKMGFLDQMKVFSMLIIVMTLVYVSLIIWYRDLGRPIFLEAIFGLTHMYNVTSNTWTNATLSQARGWLASTSVANRYALFAGGVVGTSYFDTVDVYDLYGGIWTSTNFGQALADLASASLGNLAFFGGGDNGTCFPCQTFNLVDIFNATTQTWSTATLSQNRSWLAAASIGDMVAFGGGSPDGSTLSSVVDMFNATSNIWFTTSLSQPRGLLAATSSTNKIFFGGGYSSSGVSNTVDIFDIPLPPPPPPTPTPTPTPKLSVSTLIGGPFELVLVLGLCLVISLLPQ
jgi:hypothetical protein